MDTNPSPSPGSSPGTSLGTRLAADRLLGPLTAAALDPVFWPVARTGVHSAWITHVPFAHWLVTALRPRSIVELGTHNGVSYSAFCEAVQRTGLDCRCLAVDTWQGDEHAGHYGDAVYDDLRRFHDARYGGFSELWRGTFDAALGTVPDGTVDLLHIDGLHTYAAVRADFEAWRPKLSAHGVVLFHDTTVRDNGFGVWRLWAELSGQHPSFEFLHGHGLGVLAVGAEAGEAVGALCAASAPAISALRERFSALGERWGLQMQAALAQTVFETEMAEAVARAGAAGRAEREGMAADLDEACRQRDTARIALRRAAVFAENGWRSLNEQAEARAKAAEAHAAAMEQQARDAADQAAAWQHSYHALRGKLDRLLRRLWIVQASRLVPKSVRQAIRGRLVREP